MKIPEYDADLQHTEDNKIILGILQAIDKDDSVTQRAVASELGIALGLANAYVKRCMKKGLIKIRTAPARRYAYYLTPRGFSEKSRLMANYLSHSFSFFRKARTDCEQVLADAASRRLNRLVLVGGGDLAEIVVLCAAEQRVKIVAIVDRTESSSLRGVPVVPSFSDLTDVDGVVITNLSDPNFAFESACAAFGADRVLSPALLKINRPQAARSPTSIKAPS